MPARIPSDDLRDAVRELAIELGKPPTANDMREHGEYSPGALISRWGSWNEALREAGVGTNFEYDSSNHGASKEVLLEEIRRVAEIVGRSPTFDEFKEIAHVSPQSYYVRFDSFFEAKIEAGVGEYEREPNLKDVECDWCETELHRYESQIHEHTFCSKDCHDEWQRRHRGGEDDPNRNRIEVDCANCGTTLQRKPSRVENYERQFCDMECLGEWRSAYKSGERSPVYSQVEIDCARCGTTISFPESRIERSDNLFCGMDCRADWLSENQTGEDSFSYVERVQVECETCGETLLRVPSRAERTDHHFCDRVCKAEWHSEEFRGEDHPRWKGGYSPYYGSNWHEQRQARREKDEYRCQSCGITEREHVEQYDRELEVHHIKRIGDFDKPEDANALENLVTLCRSCHKRWEGIELRPTLFD